MVRHVTKYPNIAQRIKSARLRKGLSMDKAAAAVGTTRFTWIRWEQGLNKPEEYASRLSAMLGVPEAHLLNEAVSEGDDEEAASLPVARESEFLEALRPLAQLLAKREAAA